MMNDDLLPRDTALKGGDFVVRKVLGRGGFGITYRGTEVRLRRDVAIKELFIHDACWRTGMTVAPKRGVMSHEDLRHARARFLKEARTLARFTDPRIVRVYTAFDENDTSYMVMEYLRGRTLYGVLCESGGRMNEQQAVRYVTQVGEALKIVHGDNILHRDVKPDNVLVTNDGRTVLLDFGAARGFAASRPGTVSVVLTPGYAPLEQYGEHPLLGEFTDVYALGATLYHLLTGRRPIASTDRAAGTVLESPDAIDGSISRVVSDAVMKAMKIRVSDRLHSVSEFLDLIGDVRQDRPAGRHEFPDACSADDAIDDDAPTFEPDWTTELPPVRPVTTRTSQDAGSFDVLDRLTRRVETLAMWAGGLLGLGVAHSPLLSMASQWLDSLGDVWWLIIPVALVAVSLGLSYFSAVARHAWLRPVITGGVLGAVAGSVVIDPSPLSLRIGADRPIAASIMLSSLSELAPRAVSCWS